MIRTEDLSYRISNRWILRRVNLNVEKGQTLAVMGMSGVGKSTLLRIMAGLLKPESGKVFIDGQDITVLSETNLFPVRKKIGMVFQNAALFDSMNVYENVSFGLRRHTDKSEDEIADIVAERLTLVGLKDTQELMPSELSGGMKKRVGLARALALNPEVVFYDEPTAGLDPIASAVISDLIVAARDTYGVTSVVVSHDIQSINRVANNIAMLHKAKIIAQGSVEDMNNCEDCAVKQFMKGMVEGPIKLTI
ncbi:MAG: ABC transporter ATP-binding protein [Armatimonadota bacterium]